MQRITASGTPYELRIGYKHGSEAKLQVSRSIKFYDAKFQEAARMNWSKVQQRASKFQPVIEQKWPSYLEEMKGLADGAGVELLDIIALNVRTEIAFGLFSDGCTSIGWKTASHSFLAQNWDWEFEQKENLILLTIQQQDKPTIKMVTEAGLIGKIGINSDGVGVLLNAIRAPGLDETRLPCHLALRLVLDCSSREEAETKLEAYGVASSCHLLIADVTGSVGMEFSSVDVQKLEMNTKGQVFHSNHYLVKHALGVQDDPKWLADSVPRVNRIEELAKAIDAKPTFEMIENLFVDEKGYPGSVCRGQREDSTVETLFNIVMDLKNKSAVVKLGRPVKAEEVIKLSF